MPRDTNLSCSKSRRVARRGVGLCAALMILGSASARADEINPTAQAVTMHATWLPTAPAPAKPVAICLVDTGVNLNDDTSPIVVEREAQDGGSPDDVDPDDHGTLMAMTAAAPANGEGMVGVSPQAARIVSERAAPPPPEGQTTSFPFGAYASRIRRCRAIASTYNIKVIELALGGHSSDQADRDELASAVTAAHDAGFDVVAAAGNDGGPIEEPANIPGVFGIGGATSDGSLCDISSRGAGLDLTAPGCDLDGADPTTLQTLVGGSGTSQASVMISALLASLRAYKPDLSWQQAEQLLSSTADGQLVDAAAAWRSAGLGSMVTDPSTPPEPTTEPSMSTVTSTAPEPTTTNATSTYLTPPPTPDGASATGAGETSKTTPTVAATVPLARLRAPRVQLIRQRGRTVIVHLAPFPGRLAAIVELQRRAYGHLETVRTVRSLSDTVHARVHAEVVRAKVHFVDTAGVLPSSTTTAVRLRR